MSDTGPQPQQRARPEPAQPPQPIRRQIVVEADRIINGDRQAAYGDAAASFDRLGKLWAPILGVPVSAKQVALCLLQLKVSRALTAEGHADSYVDMVGYAALAGEIDGAVVRPPS